MKLRTQKIFERVTEQVDAETGQLLATQTMAIDVLVRTDEEFAFIFSKLLQYALRLEGTEIKVLLWCIMNARMDNNEVSLNRVQKERIREDTSVYKGKHLVKAGLSVSSVENAVSALKKKQLLLPVGRALYQVNPMLAWRGKIKNRHEAVKLLINLGKQGPE